MSKHDKPVEKTEFDTNPLLTPFKGCPEVHAVTLRHRVVSRGGSLQNLESAARSATDRFFLRQESGIRCITHVDPTAVRGLPVHIPLENVACFISQADVDALNARLAQAEAEQHAAQERALEEQRLAMLDQEARTRKSREEDGAAA